MAADQQTGAALDRLPGSALTATTQRRSSRADAGANDDSRRTKNGVPAEREDGRGRNANRPSEITVLGWKDIFWRVWEQFNKDRILLVAAGATFYLLLALFPALAAFVSIYGFVADPATVADHVAYLGGLLPREGLDIIRGQLQSLARQNNDSLSVGFLLGFVLAVWSANSGIKTIFDAMNIAYEEDEKRGFFRLNALSLSFTVGALLIGVVMILAVGIVPALLALLHLDAWAEILISVVRWPLLMLAIVTGIAFVYRFGPSREKAKWRWLTVGAIVASLVWVAASWLFSFYLQNFADYNATYGSLGAVIGLMMWTWISVAILILGGAVNAEMEHQTARDTTTGDPQPMGDRGAYMADTLGKPAD